MQLMCKNFSYYNYTLYYTFRYPSRIVFSTLLVCWAMCFCLLPFMEMESKPEKIWVPANSVAEKQKHHFDSNFGPFFRIEQLIFTSAAPNNVDLIQTPYLERLATVQQDIIQHKSGNKSFGDFCFRPIQGKGCLVESPMQLWLGNKTLLMDDPNIKLTVACQSQQKVIRNRAPCMDKIGTPIMQNVIFGGISNDEKHVNRDPCGATIPKAKALMVTFLLNNANNGKYLNDAMDWEQDTFLNISAAWDERLRYDTKYPMRVSRLSERSVQDGLGVQTRQNAFVMVGSYMLMFFYISLALGKSYPTQDFVRSRILVGFCGIIIVITSVLSSLAICSAMGVRITMIVVEVVPFLVLAIGVDNMFILCHTFDKRMKFYESQPLLSRQVSSVDDRIFGCAEATLADVGSSISLAAISETLAFLVGILSNIPALQSFCLVAAIAVAINWVLQTTCFLSILILDAYRMETGRYDVFPWLRKKVVKQIDTDQVEIVHQADSLLERILKRCYIPILFSRVGKLFTFAIFGMLLITSLLGLYHSTMGLEQELAMPKDYYLYDYLRDQSQYGEVGPIGYVVFQNADYTSFDFQRHQSHMKDKLALLSPKFISSPVYSWLASFNQWRQMRTFLELKRKQGLADCPTQQHVLFPFQYEVDEFPEEYSNTTQVTPNELFYPLVHTFTKIPIESSCCQHFGFCGEQYQSDIVFKTCKNHTICGIQTSRYRFEISKLENQQTFINSYYYLDHYVQKWSKLPGKAIGSSYVYSLYFLYYEQYFYIKAIALQCIIFALGSVFTATLLLLNFQTALLLTIMLSTIMCNMIGILYLWNILSPHEYPLRLNAISVVNLVMAGGMAVEFCIHIIVMYAIELKKSTTHPMKKTMLTSSKTLISGIAMTKIVGLSVLGLAPSHLYRIYFFRMYIAIIISGLFHALFILPILLSYAFHARHAKVYQMPNIIQ